MVYNTFNQKNKYLQNQFGSNNPLVSGSLAGPKVTPKVAPPKVQGIISPTGAPGAFGTGQTTQFGTLSPIQIKSTTPITASPAATNPVKLPPAASSYIDNQLKSQAPITTQAPTTAQPTALAPNDPSNKFNTATGVANPSYVDPNAKPAPSAYDKARTDYLASYKSYLDSLKPDPNADQTAQNNVNALNQRTADELLRNRKREDELRGNEIGQLERGQTYQMNEEERLSNRSLADLAIAKGVSLDSIKLAEDQRKEQQAAAKAGLDFAQSEVGYNQGEEPVEINGQLVQRQSDGSYKSVFSAPKEKTQPTSVQEYEYAKEQGYPGSFNQYQNDDANRKAKASGTGGLSSAQINSTVNSIAGAFDNEQTVKDYNTVSGYVNLFNDLGTSASDDQARIYAFAKVMDPNSVVRESEYKTVQQYSQALLKAAGINVARVFTDTGALSPAARSAMSTTLGTKLNVQQKLYTNVSNEYQRQINDAYSGKQRQITNYNTPQSQPQVDPQIGELQAQGYSPEQIQQIINAN